jgi:hypothetical protein
MYDQNFIFVGEQCQQDVTCSVLSYMPLTLKSYSNFQQKMEGPHSSDNSWNIADGTTNVKKY